MYGKIYESIFDSSIMEEGIEVRYVWHCMIILADREGNVDVTEQALARRINTPVHIVHNAITKLMEPDPSSRSSADEGRRIVLIDVHREWGWHLVNREQYRDIRNPSDRATYFREYKRKKRAEARSPHVDSVDKSAGHTSPPQAEAEAEAYTEAEEKEGERERCAPPVSPAPPPPKKRTKVPPILECPILPPVLDTPGFRDLMRRRLAERAEKGARARQTPEQLASQIRQLAKLAGAQGLPAAEECLERATSNGWAGVVFREDFDKPKSLSRPGSPGVTAAIRAEYDRPLYDPEAPDDGVWEVRPDA